jgi:hypothetical protein
LIESVLQLAAGLRSNVDALEAANAQNNERLAEQIARLRSLSSDGSNV